MTKITSNFKGKLHQYFIKKLRAFDYRRGWMKSRCPYCGREGKFGINISRNHCNCFVCGQHPNVFNLIMYLEKVDTYSEVYQILDKDEYSGYVFKEEKSGILSHKPIYLPEGFINIRFGDSTLGRSARNYVKKRGFDINQVSMSGWGYGTKGKYLGYLIIPFHEKGKLVYYNARLFFGNGPKYNNPEVSDTGIGKSFILYNKDALEIFKTIYLCEGAINAETMGKQGIASGGKIMSRYQINEIIRSQVERVIILFDPDAKDRAIEVALKLIPYKKVKVIFLPEGKDVNDIGRKATLKLIYSQRYLSYQELFKLKQNL